MRQLEALADGVMEAAQARCAKRLARARNSQSKSCSASGRRLPAASTGWKPARQTDTLTRRQVNLATISTACAIAYLNFRRVAPGWCVDPAATGEAGGCVVPARQLCAYRTAADLTQAGNSLRKEALQSPLIVDSLSRRRGKLTYRQAHS